VIKIIGIGSPFGEDQAGWKVIEMLQQTLSSQSKIEIVSYDRPGIHLLSYIQNLECVYLIDAVKSGAVAGTIHRFENETINECHTLLSTHDFGVVQTLKMGQALNMLPKKIILYGIEINPAQNDGFISEVTQQAIQLVSEKITHELTAY
jgi:hydrogenase maturation protease